MPACRRGCNHVAGLPAGRPLARYFSAGAQGFQGFPAGLYGTVAPRTVANFLATVRAGAYNNTLFTKAFPGQYVVAGRYAAGPGWSRATAVIPRLGAVASPTKLQSTALLCSCGLGV